MSARFEPRLEKLLSQQKAQKHNRTQEIVIQINQRLEQGFRDTSIGAQSIAEEMGVSAAYLRKQYLTEAGVSIGDKLNQLRMDEASRLLLETDQPIESIARQIGVENTKYFFVLFKKFKGMTPRQFRCKARDVPFVKAFGRIGMKICGDRPLRFFARARYNKRTACGVSA